jgi:hypothetical protein
MVYPEGNWVTATDDSPSFMIVRTAYGKPILDRLLDGDTALPQAVALAYLAFDATRASVVDVEFPIDVVVWVDGELRELRFEAAELAEVHDFWHSQLACRAGGAADGVVHGALAAGGQRVGRVRWRVWRWGGWRCRDRGNGGCSLVTAEAVRRLEGFPAP